LRHLKPDEILLLFSFDSSESFLPGIKSLKNSITIPSGPQVLELGVDEISSLISLSLYILINFPFFTVLDFQSS